MQFYVNGYEPGDPLVEQAREPESGAPQAPPDEVDVLIVGCGPAGLVLAAQLARFPEIRTAVVDRRDGPLEMGQADGVACRTVEMFQSFGLAHRLIDEAYWVNEVCFWQPDPDDPRRIKRTGRVVDTEEGLSEFPHVTVNQARMLAYLLEVMERSSSRLEPFYGLHALDVEIDESTGDHPVAVTLKGVHEGRETGEVSRIRARYVVGCDGARSAIRGAIGRELVGSAKNVSWGVMDVLGETDFPDIRIKCTIQSATDGTIVLIPREGGYLARFYIELDGERDRDILERGQATPEKLSAVANRILHPYRLDVRDVGWSSIYEIGQRLSDKFDDVPAGDEGERLPRVFIAGDACHTHSAKAGQGMNVSMADAFNLGWKLAAVLRGVARPELLHTYSEERQRIAQELIDFDEEWSSLLSSPLRSKENPDGIDPAEFQEYFVRHARYTAGVATAYAQSEIVAAPGFQNLANGFPIGMRFHSAPVIRLADAKPMQLGHVAEADGAWRLYVFADEPGPSEVRSRARELCEFLASPVSPLTRFTPPNAAPDSVLDVRAIFQQSHRELEHPDMPTALRPRKGRFDLVDHEKVFCPDPAAGDIFDARGIDRQQGCMVLVRPDQYVANVLPLDAHEDFADFLSEILIDRTQDHSAAGMAAAVSRMPA